MRMETRTETRMSDRDRISEAEIPPSGGESFRGESLRYVIAGILSTITVIPAQTHPSEMLEISDLVIQTVRLMGIERGNLPMGGAGQP